MSSATSEHGAMYKHNLIVVTPRLILRGEDPDDPACVAAIYRMRSDEASLRYAGYKPPDSLEEVRTLIEGRLAKPQYFNFVAELRYPTDPSLAGSAENIVGMIGGVRNPEFGYQIDSKHWGKGYAVEAMRAVIAAYWSNWPEGMPSLSEEERHKIVLHVLPEHGASVAVALKLGFVECLAIGKDTFSAEGTSEHTILSVYELRRPQAARNIRAGSTSASSEKYTSS